MKFKDLIGLITGILILFGIMFGTYQFFEKHYALADEVKQTVQTIQQRQEKESKRLDYKILSDQLKSIQDRIWKIQDRFEKKKIDDTTKEELRTLEQKKEEYQKKLDVLEKEK